VTPDQAFVEICKRVEEDAEEILKRESDHGTYMYLMGRIHVGTSAAILLDAVKGGDLTKKVYTRLGWWSAPPSPSEDVAPAESEDQR